MLDRKRILSKIDELDTYLAELEDIAPLTFDEYENSVEKRRACERLLQISVETVMDITYLIIKGMMLGMPSDENNMFEQLGKKNVLPKETVETLKGMKGFRNILVHRYGSVDDELVFAAVTEKMHDFEKS